MKILMFIILFGGAIPLAILFSALIGLYAEFVIKLFR